MGSTRITKYKRWTAWGLWTRGQENNMKQGKGSIKFDGLTSTMAGSNQPVTLLIRMGRRILWQCSKTLIPENKGCRNANLDMIFSGRVWEYIINCSCVNYIFHLLVVVYMGDPSSPIMSSQVVLYQQTHFINHSLENLHIWWTEHTTYTKTLFK